jgi:hypothetical protein
MAQLAHIQQCRPEYSENLLPIIEGRALTITEGMANGSVNYNTNIYFDEGSSIKMDITSSGLNKFINFNLSDYSVTAPKTGSYIFSYRLKKVNPTDSIDFAVEIFVNGILSTETTYDNNLAVNGDWTNLNWNTFAQSISLDAGDVLTFRFIMNTDLLITSLYLDGLKLELDDRFLGIPSIYSKPLVTESETGFQSRTDETNNQSLLALTDNLVSFSGVLEENGGLDLLDSSAKVTPIGLNDIISVDFAFTGVVPIGTNLFLSIYLKVDGNIFRATTLPIIKGVGLDDHFSVSWILPVGADFLSNGATIHVNPLVAMTIKNRYVSVTRLAKGK